MDGISHTNNRHHLLQGADNSNENFKDAESSWSRLEEGSLREVAYCLGDPFLAFVNTYSNSYLVTYSSGIINDIDVA
jgi:hypothetical protein